MSDAPEIITVDVKGAVKQPGVYELRSNSRVHDAIYKAGGMTADANSQSVNLAQKLSDEAVIYVAKEGEDVPALGSSESPATSSASAEKTGKVHLNRASESELQTVSGIGQKLSLIHIYLWQGDPEYWSGQAPVLFPICGSVRNGQVQYHLKDGVKTCLLYTSVATVANDGKRVSPHVVEGIYDNNDQGGLGQLKKTIETKELNQVHILSLIHI